ncbi:sensor histidine kinase [Arthrobacter sp. 35W]|uniref:sensor histidine kinase n=1 Tax=Arthrobacter sp. 35W TaxID=1132441 RepID=UPI00054ED160|nr:sensor histidine kinase [Arthrobacter sp. 35W]
MRASDTVPGAPARRPSLERIDAVVHFGFAVLMVASGVRYTMRHSPADNLWVLAAAAAVAILYASVAVLARHREPHPVWMLALMAVWVPLVLSAPSFAWCSFALYFLCRAAFSGAVAYTAAAATTVATAAGLFRLSGGTDIAMLLGPLAVGVLLTVVYDRIEADARIQRQLHREVEAAQERLLASEREAGAAAERERVSREIHDTVTQGLASNILLLEAAARSWPAPSALADIRQAGTLLRGNLAETRSLVHELSSPGSDDVPLPAALLEAATAYVGGAELAATGLERPVPLDVRHAMVRVAQSACANITLHAGASRTVLTLGYLPDAVTLDIHDDGRGFDPQLLDAPSADGGYGLRAMRQRVEQLGGTFSVESTPGEGTIVAAQIPLPLLEDTP